MTEGALLLNKYHEGEFKKASLKSLITVKLEVSQALEELLDVGARIRPLMVGDRRVGWVRGVHPIERQALRRWGLEDQDLITQLLRLGTSLSEETLENLSFIEVRSILRLIEEMTSSDLSLYPFLSAFITTSQSEHLWFASGSRITNLKEARVTMPDGAVMYISQPPDHARLWAALCHYREKNKQRIDDTMNALLILRPWVGKGANSMASDLKVALNSMAVDIDEPWTNVVAVKRDVNLDDGWAHGGDDSIEGIKRELEGMKENDRHEQLMATFANKFKAEAAEKLKAVNKLVEDYGPGVFSSKPQILTEAEVLERMAKLTKGQPANLVQTDFAAKDDGTKIFEKYS